MQGFKKTLSADDLHVTIAFSKEPLEWPQVSSVETVLVPAGRGREIKHLGDKGAVVLRFDCEDLADRWEELRDAGAVWDYESYQPHVTITYDGGGIDLSKVDPYQGDLIFGPEQFREVSSNWYERAKKSLVSATDTSTIAMDRASVRRIDDDGHLFVEITPISKANVCPYRGSEIPGAEELGLDPDRIYNLYRDPKELEKAAKSFEGKPLLLIHKPVSAEDHPREITIGSVGNGVKFRAPFLMAPLNIWDGEAIDLIESERQKELSCGYRYAVDMTPGETPDGESYDGVMRDIHGNHVALVEEGRAGPDVAVGDDATEVQWAILEQAILDMAAA
jgi:hypothetical protein